MCVPVTLVRVWLNVRVSVRALGRWQRGEQRHLRVRRRSGIEGHLDRRALAVVGEQTSRDFLFVCDVAGVSAQRKRPAVRATGALRAESWVALVREAGDVEGCMNVSSLLQRGWCRQRREH